MQACGYQVICGGKRVLPHVQWACAQPHGEGGEVLALKWVQMTQEGCGVWALRASRRAQV